MTSRGLGDDIAKITEATGIKSVVDKVSEAINVPCGCKKRQEALNNLFPYKDAESR
jgi:glycerol dehydrogenase-like iron-containing ADH family enzyme